MLPFVTDLGFPLANLTSLSIVLANSLVRSLCSLTRLSPSKSTQGIKLSATRLKIRVGLAEIVSPILHSLKTSIYHNPRPRRAPSQSEALCLDYAP